MEFASYVDLIVRFLAALVAKDAEELRRMATPELLAALGDDKSSGAESVQTITVTGIEIEGNGKVIDVHYATPSGRMFSVTVLDDGSDLKVLSMPRETRGKS